MRQRNQARAAWAPAVLGMVVATASSAVAGTAARAETGKVSGTIDKPVAADAQLLGVVSAEADRRLADAASQGGDLQAVADVNLSAVASSAEALSDVAPPGSAPTFIDAHVDGADGWDAYLHEAGTVAHPPLNEISGIACSRTYPGIWWVHNDSGDEPRIFAIDAEGRLVMPAWRRESHFADRPEEDKQPWPGIPILGAANQDWEDLTLADGVLYISDMGNNGNAKRDLGVYLVSEPNPAAMDQGARPIRFIHIAYPDQNACPPEAPDDWRFDCEAVFIYAGRLYFLTKYRADQRFDRITTGTSLYRLDTLHADRVNVLTLIHRADDLPIIPTSAELSPDGKRLAVLSHDAVWLYDTPAEGDDWLAGRAIRLPISIKMGQAEGVCWDDDATLRLVNEQRGVFTLDLSPLKPAD